VPSRFLLLASLASCVACVPKGMKSHTTLNPNGSPNGPSGPSGPNPGIGAFIASTQVARRLSQAELNNVLRDTFADTANAATTFLREDEYAPYDNDYTLQDPSQELVDSMQVLAEDVATRVLADPMKRAQLVPCTPTGPGDAACFKQVIQTIGRRALRRTLADDEVAGYMTLQSYATQTDPNVMTDFYTAVALLIEALLQDPEVLYRIEAGAPTQTNGIVQLTPNEIATRMSFLLWGSGPDDALLDAADQGSLMAADERRAAAQRMLTDDRAKAQLHRFHSMWLGYRVIPHPATLDAEYNTETTALIDRVVFTEKRPYTDLFSIGETYVDNTLADLYQIPHPATSPGWVQYPADSQRAGILSQGSVLSAFSKFTDTSPTQRGILVRTRLMCLPALHPPPTVNVDIPPGQGGTAVCKKDRYAEHEQNPGCSGCHSQMDPIGFGLERFDFMGAPRTHDDGHPECPLDGQGVLPGMGPFSGPAQLSQMLLSANMIQSCAVKQYLTYAVGRQLDDSEGPFADSLASGFQMKSYDFSELMMEYVTNEAFALKQEAN
jgi:hypothetical protein